MRTMLASFLLVTGCGAGLGQVHMGRRPRHVWDEQVPVYSGGYSGGFTCGPDVPIMLCGPDRADTYVSGAAGTTTMTTVHHDSDRPAFGVGLSAYYGFASLRFGEREASTNPLRIEGQAGYARLGGGVGAAVVLGAELVDHAAIDPDLLVSVSDLTMDLGVRLAKGFGALSLDGAVAYSNLDGNGVRVSAGAAIALPMNLFWYFDHLVPHVEIAQTSADYTAADLAGTTDTLRVRSVMFQLLLVAPHDRGWPR